MGIYSSFRRSCARMDMPLAQRSPVDPDPDNFEVRWMCFGRDSGYTVAKVWYPGCTTYEGEKILVFVGDRTVELMKSLRLDPHFSGDGLSPVARFAPTDEGRRACFRLTGVTGCP